MSEAEDKPEEVEVKIQPETQEEEQKQPDVEARARRMGWVPKDEFRGPDTAWKDAEAFIEAGEAAMPVLRERNRKLDAEVAKLQAIVRDLPGKLSKIEQQMYERATKELKDRQRKAVESGDVEEFDAVEREISSLQKQAKEDGGDKKPADTQPIVDAWAKQNPWFNDDEDMAAYAEGLHTKTWNGDPDTLEENLQMVTDRVKKMFAAKFENPNRQRPATVEGNGAKVKTKRGKGYDDMPAEARAVCDELVAAKVLTRDEYIKDYFEGER